MTDDEMVVLGRALMTVWFDLPALAQGQILAALADHPEARAALDERGGGERLAPRVALLRETWRAEATLALAKLR